MKKRLAILLLVALFVGTELQAQDAAKPKQRIWTDAAGSKLTAAFVRISGNSVVLRNSDNKVIRVRLADLSPADRSYVESQKPIQLPEAEVRTWKDATGDFNAEALFVRVSGDQVVLQLADKNQISVPMVKLSETDRQYVQVWFAKLLTDIRQARYEEARIKAYDHLLRKHKLTGVILQEVLFAKASVSYQIGPDNQPDFFFTYIGKEDLVKLLLKAKRADLKSQRVAEIDGLLHRLNPESLLSPNEAKAIRALQNFPQVRFGPKNAKYYQIEDGSIVHIRRVPSSLTDSELVYLKDLPNLKSLNLAVKGEGKYTDTGLEHLKGLTKLEELHFYASDTGLVHVKGLTKLGKLHVLGNKITDAGLEHLKGLTKLKDLLLFGTKITDAGLVHLKGLTNLEALRLERTQITDAGLVHFKELTSLEDLNLNFSKITDAGLLQLAGLANLKRLDLKGTLITDAGLEHLKGLKKLEGLNLYETKITNIGYASLKKALPGNIKIYCDFSVTSKAAFPYKLNSSPTLEKMIQLTTTGTAKEKIESQELLNAVRTAAASGILNVTPERQRVVAALLLRLMNKKDANAIINVGIEELGGLQPDDIVPIPGVPTRVAAFMEIQMQVHFGTAQEKEEGRSLLNAITVAQSMGLGRVRPDLRRDVIRWLPLLIGKEKANAIISP